MGSWPSCVVLGESISLYFRKRPKVRYVHIGLQCANLIPVCHHQPGRGFSRQVQKVPKMASRGPIHNWSVLFANLGTKFWKFQWYGLFYRPFLNFQVFSQLKFGHIFHKNPFWGPKTHVWGLKLQYFVGQIFLRYILPGFVNSILEKYHNSQSANKNEGLGTSVDTSYW